MKIKESCPKCNSTDIVFSGNWTGEMVSDIHAEHFWIAKCNSWGLHSNHPMTKTNLVR